MIKFREENAMREVERKKFWAIIERDKETGLYVGYVPSIPGVHSQGETIDELIENLKEVLELVSSEIDISDSDFVGIQEIYV